MLYHNTDKHNFALYWQHVSMQLDSVDNDQCIVIQDDELYHRITRVLRLAVGETFIVFDQQSHAYVQIQHKETKNLVVKVISHHTNTIYAPHITFLLPLLKRDALHTAIYNLVQAGVSLIHLMITEKTSFHWTDKELIKLNKIAIAAAEQSKNFSFPSITPPQSLSTLLSQSTNNLIFFFDSTGNNFSTYVHTHLLKQPNAITLVIGPEGDLSLQEKSLLRQYPIEFLRLTPTILRAEDAALCACALIRSLSN